MIRVARRGLALVGTAVLTAGVLGVTPATVASARPNALSGLASATPFSQAQFAAYGTGSEAHLDLVATGASKLGNVEQAFSANTVSSAGLKGAMVSPITGALVQSDQTANNANAYGRGSGLEIGLGLSTAQAAQIQAGLAEAHAPPPMAVAKTAIPVDLRPLLQAFLLTGKAAAAYNTTFCPLGQPLAYGEGDASAPTAVAGQPANTALVSATGASNTQTAQTRTRTDLVANADGTFGIQNTVQEVIAPLTVNIGPAVTLAITVQGDGPNAPFTLQTFNTGEGQSGVRFLNNDPVVKIDLTTTTLGIPTTVTLANVKLSALAPIINPLLGTGGLTNTLLKTLGVNLSIDVGSPTPLKPLKNAPAGSTSESFDLLAINASVGSLTVADLRLGHAESEVSLPNGPIACTIPVSKNANPPSVSAGQSFVQTISIPSSATALNDSACDLTNIHVTDKIAVNSGSPSFTVGSISNGGTYDAASKTITWANIGNYHPGDTPKMLTVNFTIPSNSSAGVLQDTAFVTAGLGNCTGNAFGQASLIGDISNLVINGQFVLVGPTVGAGGGGGALPRTGGPGPMIAWVGAALLAAAEVTRRLVQRSRQSELS